MGGCYGWLLWVVAMGGCYGRLLWAHTDWRLQSDCVPDPRFWFCFSRAQDVVAVNQRWAGHPGTRLSFSGAVTGNLGNSSQTWAKAMGKKSFAVFFMSTGPMPSTLSLPFSNVSTEIATTPVCIRDLYTKADTGPVDPTTTNIEATVLAHDSVFLCVRPAVGGHCGSFEGCPAFPL